MVEDAEQILHEHDVYTRYLKARQSYLALEREMHVLLDQVWQERARGRWLLAKLEGLKAELDANAAGGYLEARQEVLQALEVA